MGQVIVRTNPLDDSEFVAHQHEGPLISLFLKTHPQGFGGPAVVMMNGRKLAPVDFDLVVGERDEVLVLIAPAVSETVLVGAVISALVSAAVNYAISWLLGSPESPDTPTTAATASPVYSLSVPTNQARLGEPIPVQYGRVLAVPDIISQPYTIYQNNQMYLIMLLGLGHGDHTIHGLQVADTPVDQMQNGIFNWWDYEQANHQSTLGIIQYDLTSQAVYEDVYTSAEVSDQEIAQPPGEQRYGDVSGANLLVSAGIPALADVGSLVYLAVDLLGYETRTIVSIAGDRLSCVLDHASGYSGNVGVRFYAVDGTTIGPFLCCGPTQETTLLLLDVEFPEGLFRQDGATGEIGEMSVDIQFSVTPVDSGGNAIGPTGFHDVNYRGNSTSPMRFTEWWSGLDGRYSVGAKRLTLENPNSIDRSRAVWTALRAVLHYAPVASDGIDYVFDSNIETDLSAWDQTDAGVVPWGLVAEGTCDVGGPITPASTNPTFISAAGGNGNYSDGWIERHFDVTPYADQIDAGGVTFTAGAKICNWAVGNDPGEFAVVFRSSAGGTTLGHEFAVLNGGCMWQDAPLSGTVPVGTRLIDVQCVCRIEAATYLSTYFDDVFFKMPVVPVDHEPEQLYYWNSVLESDVSQWSAYNTGGKIFAMGTEPECTELPPYGDQTLIIMRSTVGGSASGVGLYREFDVSQYATEIDAGAVTATLQAQAAALPSDEAIVRLAFRNASTGYLGTHDSERVTGCTWQAVSVIAAIPALTRTIQIAVVGYDVNGDARTKTFWGAIDLSINIGEPVAPSERAAYLDTHVVPVKIKATNGIASDATNRVAVDCTRMLNGADSVNPADALEDIYTSDSYGPGRPDSEIDQSALSALRAKWATDGREFNAVFDQRSTVWDSMGQAVRVAHAFPTLYGSTITLVEDQPATQIAVAFTVDNIAVESLSIGYRWTADDFVDGYEVEYRDATSFAPMYALFPTTSAKPESVVLFGCTDYDTACEHAQMLWNKHLYRRKQATFKTETEGHIPLVGELISITHRLILDGSTPETYIVEAVKPAGEFAVSIEAIRYDDRVYTIGEC